MKKLVHPGIDQFLNDQHLYKHHQFGIVTNDAAVTSADISTRLALLQNNFNIKKIFSPEHGIAVTGADGLFQNNTIDKLTGLPVISLYGNYLSPAENDLSDIDAVLFDIPDVGCRFYTYLWTMTHVMEACARNNKPLIVLDRPNPIGGNLEKAEGPMLDEKSCASFIGRWSIPIRYCCTLGELANYFAATKIKNLQLKIIGVKNWQRNELALNNENKFVPTSPAIKNKKIAMLYPGMGLLEGVNVNEGRGTNRPFQICGAPWINNEELDEIFSKKILPGLQCKPISYTPSDGLYKNQICHGLELFISDELSFLPVKTGLELLSTIVKLYPEKIKERLYCTNANPTGTGHLDKLLGTPNAFERIQKGEMPDTDVSKSWPSVINPFILY